MIGKLHITVSPLSSTHLSEQYKKRQILIWFIKTFSDLCSSFCLANFIYRERERRECSERVRGILMCPLHYIYIFYTYLYCIQYDMYCTCAVYISRYIKHRYKSYTRHILLFRWVTLSLFPIHLVIDTFTRIIKNVLQISSLSEVD